MQSSLFLQICKRLQAFGIISLQIEHHKIVDNVHLQLQVFKDELVSAWGTNKEFEYVKDVALHLNAIKELFGSVFDEN